MENTKERRIGIMRLHNIFYVCKSCLPSIEEACITNVKNNEEFVRVRGWKECKRALDVLKRIDCFKEEIEDLYNLIDWQVGREYINLPSDQKDDFVRKILTIKSSVKAMVKLCDMMEIGGAESGIDVKIPKCESLKEYMGYLKEIDFIFTQCPYLLHEKEEIKFNTVDVGSQWLVFAVAGATGAFYILNNLAKLIHEAVKYKSNILICKQQEEALKEMQQKNEVMQETIDAFKKLNQVTTNKYMGELESELGELPNSEEQDKVKRTIEKLVFLMDKGVEIYSSIETPKEIKVLFPFEKDTAILPDNVLKLIEEKNLGEEEE